MRGRLWQTGWLVLLVAASACAPKEDAIAFDNGIVRVINQTSQPWTDIRVVVNHHYHAQAAGLEPGGRLTAPVDKLVAGFGQRFNRGRQSVFLIEVKAQRRDGQPVRLLWRNGRYVVAESRGAN